MRHFFSRDPFRPRWVERTERVLGALCGWLLLSACAIAWLDPLVR